MSDIGETFKILKEIGRAKKAYNLTESTALLDQLGIEYTSKNDGIHLIITSKDGFIDFWPSTGKYYDRMNEKHGRGVFRLLKLIGITLEK